MVQKLKIYLWRTKGKTPFFSPTVSTGQVSEAFWLIFLLKMCHIYISVPAKNQPKIFMGSWSTTSKSDHF